MRFCPSTSFSVFTGDTPHYCKKVREENRPGEIAIIQVKLSKKMAGWFVVMKFTALRDNVSVNIRPSPREREKDKRNNGRERCPNHPFCTSVSTVGSYPGIILALL